MGLSFAELAACLMLSALAAGASEGHRATQASQLIGTRPAAVPASRKFSPGEARVAALPAERFSRHRAWVLLIFAGFCQ